MKKILKFGTLFIYLLFFVSCGGGGGSGDDEISPPPGPEPIPLPIPSDNPPLQNVLILYDNVGEYKEQGKINALLLENLLGHFDINITSKPAEQYIANEIVDKNVTTVFYLGTTYLDDNITFKDSPDYTHYLGFFEDIATQNKTVVWINYNLDLLQNEWDVNTDVWRVDTFEKSTGFIYSGVDSNYTRVWYKNTELYKGVIPFATPGADTLGCYDEGNNTYACALELNTIEVSNEENTTIHAEANSTIDLNILNEPYITQGGNFWFIGDIPFSYMSEEDRYLAFADLLHDILGIDHNETHQAIMRLEDVNAETDLDDLSNIADYMRDMNISFNIATIPQYEDPWGIYHSDINTTIKLSDSDIGTLLKEYYDERLIDIVQHGFSHQYDSIENPYNGVTADDFEFMIVTDVNKDGNYTYVGPSKSDDGNWAYQRILDGKTILEEIDIQAFAWEAPHYMAGPNHYRAIKEIYPIQYSRLIYYPDETDKSKFIGQFYPYIIRKDTYGYYVIPENIHNIEDAPNEGYRTITSEDIIRFAQKLKVVRDGVASFYYHPYLGTEELSNIIPGLQDAGYTFVRATTLVD
jgi:uncharacterized protein YdaL